MNPINPVMNRPASMHFGAKKNNNAGNFRQTVKDTYESAKSTVQLGAVGGVTGAIGEALAEHATHGQATIPHGVFTIMAIAIGAWAGWMADQANKNRDAEK